MHDMRLPAHGGVLLPCASRPARAGRNGRAAVRLAWPRLKLGPKAAWRAIYPCRMVPGQGMRLLWIAVWRNPVGGGAKARADLKQAGSGAPRTGARPWRPVRASHFVLGDRGVVQDDSGSQRSAGRVAGGRAGAMGRPADRLIHELSAAGAIRSIPVAAGRTG